MVLVTETGEFLIDASSGGIMTLVDIAWQIFLYSLRGGRFVVAFDEPENHLHPSMQRSIVPDLLRAFPQAQFIVATHSPFVVSSVKDSNVYVLAYREGEDVESQRRSNISSIKLDTANKAGSAAEILRDVLGVRVTIQEWVEENLAQTSKIRVEAIVA